MSSIMAISMETGVKSSIVVTLSKNALTIAVTNISIIESLNTLPFESA